MKRKQLVATVEKHLAEIGFAPGAFIWQPRSSNLVLIIGQTLRSFAIKTTMTKRDLIFEMGRIAGLVEAAGGIVAPKVDAGGAWRQPNGLSGDSHGLEGIPA
jgi:hypothetical protein